MFAVIFVVVMVTRTLLCCGFLLNVSYLVHILVIDISYLSAWVDICDLVPVHSLLSLFAHFPNQDPR